MGELRIGCSGWMYDDWKLAPFGGIPHDAWVVNGRRTARDR
jgi:uncharacterized protein YecE (DUF72 family)